MILQTGGMAVGETSTTSRFCSLAILIAWYGGMIPNWLPLSSMTRISRARIRSFILMLADAISSSLGVPFPNELLYEANYTTARQSRNQTEFRIPKKKQQIGAATGKERFWCRKKGRMKKSSRPDKKLVVSATEDHGARAPKPRSPRTLPSGPLDFAPF